MIDGDRLPWFHCYPSKLLGALSGMTSDQQLVYVTVLLRIYEVRGPCPDLLAALARRVGFNKRRVSDALDYLYRCGKLTSEPDGIHNPVARKVLAAGDEKRGRHARAGAAGGSRAAENRKQKQESTPSPAVATGKQLDLEIESKSVEANASTGGSPPAGAEVLPEVLDVRTRLFRSGLASLRQLTGKGDGACRKLIAQWLKNTDDDCVLVLRAIEDAEMQRPAEPVAWILGAMRHRIRGHGGKTGNGAASLLARMMKEGNDGRTTIVDDARALPAGDARRH